MNQLDDRLTSLLTRTAEAIEVQPDIERVLDPTPMVPLAGAQGPRPRRLAVLSAAVAAAAALIAVVLSIGGPDGRAVNVETPASPAGNAETPEVIPRFLVTQQGWRIISVDEPSRDFAEVTFEDDAGHGLVLTRYSAAEGGDREAQGRLGAQNSWTVTFAGHEATVFERSFSDGISLSAWWVDGDYGFELRSDSYTNPDDYRAVLATVTEVDEATWLAALPGDVVHPDDRTEVIESILAELPVPPDLDVEALTANTRPTSTSDQLQTDVTNAVICGWIQQWVDATDIGDNEARRQAVDAMATSHQWPPLVDKAGGPWTDYIWDVADAMTADVPLDAYPDIPQGTGYQRHVGCPEN
jgi:hypothetical protein